MGSRTIFNGREMDYFAGTGYLGLQSHPLVIRAAQEALGRFGLSTATSRGGYGEHPIYDELERAACAYFDAERVLYFSSGYLGSSILTQTTCNLFDHIFIDSSAHFSLWDAAHATNLPITPFHHLSPQSLSDCLHNHLRNSERPLVLSDGVFPISGEIAPLPDYLDLVRTNRGLVYLDDAHAVGVLGPRGHGTPEYYDIWDKNCSTCATLSKALGGFGGLIWGSAKTINRMDRESRIMVGASPPPLVIAAASAKALALAHNLPEIRQQLWDNVRHVRTSLRALGLNLPDTPVPIICLGAEQDINLQVVKNKLFEQSIAVELVRSYTSTPPGGALRIAIFATHTIAQIDRLIETIGKSI